MEGHDTPTRRHFTREEAETIRAAADQLDELYEAAEGKPSDLANSMAPDLRALLDGDRGQGQ